MSKTNKTLAKSTLAAGKNFKAETNALKRRVITNLKLNTAECSDEFWKCLKQGLKSGQNFKWAELYLKLYLAMFDKAWLNEVDVSEVTKSIGTKSDINKIVNELLGAILSSDNINLSEAKDLVKLLTNIEVNEEIKSTLASKLDDAQLNKEFAKLTELRLAVNNG